MLSRPAGRPGAPDPTPVIKAVTIFSLDWEYPLASKTTAALLCKTSVPVAVKIPETSIFSPIFIAPLIRRTAEAWVGLVTTADVRTIEKLAGVVTALSQTRAAAWPLVLLTVKRSKAIFLKVPESCPIKAVQAEV